MNKGFLSFIFLGLLILGGFSIVFTDWTGSFTSGVTNHDVARVGDERISQAEFSSLTERVIQVQGMNRQQAWQTGVINQILTTEVWQRMLSQAASNYGISISDIQLLTHLRKLAEPVAEQEKISIAQVIQQFMAAQGMTESAFTETIRREMATTLIRQIMGGNDGAAPSQAMLRDLGAQYLQTRDIKYVVIPNDMADVPEPTAAEIETYYVSRQSEFMIPETRDVQVALLPKEQMLKGINITESAIKSYYDSHPAEFTRDTSRKLEMVIYKTEKEANALLDAEKGAIADEKEQKEGAFLALARKTGTPATAVANEFTKTGMVPELADAVFDAKIGDIVDPIKSPLGFHVVKVISEKAAGQIPFDEARASIETRLKDENGGEAIDKILDELDRAHESGTKIAEASKRFDMTITAHNGTHRDGKGADDTDKFLNFGTGKAAVLGAIFGANDTDRVLPPTELGNGDIAVIQVNKITPAAPKPLDEVRAVLIRDYLAAKRRATTIKTVQDMLPDLLDNKKTIESIASDKNLEVQSISGGRRGQSSIPAKFDRMSWNTLFDTDIGKATALPVSSGMMIAVATSGKLGDMKAESKQTADELKKETGRAMRDEQIVQFLGALSERYGAQINNRLLEQMYAPKQGTE